MRVRTVFQSTCFTCCSNAVALSTAELLFTLVCVSVITVYNVIGSVEIINSFDNYLFVMFISFYSNADNSGGSSGAEGRLSFFDMLIK